MARNLVSPNDAAKNFVSGMSGAAARYAAGTAAVTESPMSKAAQSLDKAKQNYMASIDSGQMAAALNNVSMASWKASCAGAGSRLASGAAKGQAKYLAQMQRLAPIHQQMGQVADATQGDGADKAAAAIRVLMAAGKKGKAAGM